MTHPAPSAPPEPDHSSVPESEPDRGRHRVVSPQLWNQLLETPVRSNTFNLLFSSGSISSIYPDTGSLHFLFMSILFCFNINVLISCFYPSPRSTLPFSKVLYKCSPCLRWRGCKAAGLSAALCRRPQHKFQLTFMYLRDTAQPLWTPGTTVDPNSRIPPRWNRRLVM